MEGEREHNEHGGLYLHSPYCERKRFQKHGGSETCEPDGTSAAGKFTLLMLIPCWPLSWKRERVLLTGKENGNEVVFVLC